MPDITITATAVAWYGAIVATASCAFGAYVALRDRPRITVKASSNYRVHGATGPYDPSKKYVMVSVANAGRRPVSITHVYFTYRKIKQRSVLTDALNRAPTELTEGKSATFLAEEAGLDLSDIKAVIAIDATGREWKGRFRL